MKLIDLSTPDGVAAEALARMNRADEELRARLAEIDAQREAERALERKRSRRVYTLIAIQAIVWIVAGLVVIGGHVL